VNIHDIKAHLSTDNYTIAGSTGGLVWLKVPVSPAFRGRKGSAAIRRSTSKVKWGVWNGITPRTDVVKICTLNEGIHGNKPHYLTNN